MPTWLVITSLAVLVVLLLVGMWAFQTANRLDRLHVRYDLSWQALDSAWPAGPWWPAPSRSMPMPVLLRENGSRRWPLPPNGPPPGA